jgi:hypothetical protein
MNSWNPFLNGLSLLFLLLFLPVDSTGQKHKTGRKKTKVVSLCQKNLKQGIRGKILFQQGNHMPSPGKPANNGRPVVREIGIFELTRQNQTEEGAGGGFYKKIRTKKIRRAWSGKDGCFAVELPPGRYSFFVREKGQWYANSLGGDGEIYEVEVKAEEVTEIEFRINHSAYF